jgi:hypothetical protein
MHIYICHYHQQEEDSIIEPEEQEDEDTQPAPHRSGGMGAVRGVGERRLGWGEGGWEVAEESCGREARGGGGGGGGGGGQVAPVGLHHASNVQEQRPAARQMMRVNGSGEVGGGGQTGGWRRGARAE